MSDRLYTPSAALPPESAELPGALAALLRAAEGLTTLMPPDEAGVGVPVYEGDEAVPGEVPVQLPWMRVVVREPVNPYGSRLAPSLQRVAPVEVVVEASEDGPEGWRPRAMVSAAHAAAYAALVGQRLPSLAYAHHVGVVFCSHSPSTAAYDADLRAFYARAVYRVHLAPTADRSVSADA